MVINGKEYQDKNIDFNFICNLEESGIALSDMQKKQLSFIRFYVAYCMDLPEDVAGVEIEQHLINGGDFTEVMEVFTNKMNESDFFQAMVRRTTKKPATRKAKKVDQ